jgi:hypothetical protein
MPQQYLFSLMKSGYYKYANGTRQKVENKNDTIVRLRKPRSDFAQLEKQATGKKYNTSLIDL